MIEFMKHVLPMLRRPHSPWISISISIVCVCNETIWIVGVYVRVYYSQKVNVKCINTQNKEKEKEREEEKQNKTKNTINFQYHKSDARAIRIWWNFFLRFLFVRFLIDTEKKKFHFEWNFCYLNCRHWSNWIFCKRSKSTLILFQNNHFTWQTERYVDFATSLYLR